MAVKLILIITGTAVIIYGATRDADVVTFIGVAVFIAAFFLKQIIHEFKR